MLNAIICDKCKKEFIMSIKTEELENNIERAYLECPHCNKQYTSYYTNALVKVKQKRIKRLAEKQKGLKGTGDIRQAQKVYNQYQKLKKEIGKDMDNLRKRIEESN